MDPYYLVGIVACPLFFYRAGELERDDPGLMWAAMSVLLLLLFLLLRTGLPGMILGQIGLYAGITLYRANRKEGG